MPGGVRRVRHDMLERNSSTADNALFDAIATFFSRTLPAASQFTGRPDAAAREPDRSEAIQRFADISGYTAAVIGALTLITVLLSMYDLQALDALPAEQGFKGWQSPGVRVLVTLLVLLGIEFALIGALSVQAYSRRRLENLLKESEGRIVFALDAAALGLWRWEAATDSFWATEACNRMLGLPLDARYTMAMITDSVHADDRARVADVLRRGLEQLCLFEVDFRLALGWEGSRWVRVRAKPSVDARGVLVQLAGTIADITDTMGLRAEIEKQQQSLTHMSRVGMIGELSGALAHELNQPLTAILSNAQAVQRMIGHQPFDVQELRDAIRDIIADDARAGEVIRHLRALLKKDDAHVERVDLNAVARRALALVRSDLTARRIVLTAELSERPLLITGDPVQLQQLLLNLILNAADAMSEVDLAGGVLQVTTDLSDDDFVLVSIADTGTGIAPGIFDKLFDPFFSTKKQGLGLGLSISRSIVASHGGRLWAENNSWRGATFHISLPHARETMQ